MLCMRSCVVLIYRNMQRTHVASKDVRKYVYCDVGKDLWYTLLIFLRSMFTDYVVCICAYICCNVFVGTLTRH